MYLLDTNAVSDLVRQPDGPISQGYARARNDVVTSIIVSAEILFGLEKRPSTRLTRQVELVLSQLTVLPFSAEADRAYARIRASLQARGTPIGSVDLFIAAHAVALGATLVTDNVREFSRVDGLAVENWLRP